MIASHAKQNFGELLDALACVPVAVECHKRGNAIVCAPEAFRANPDAGTRLAERRAARADQRVVEKERLIRHQQLAIDLLLMPPQQRDDLVQRARSEVARWRRDRLCSRDYADRWDDLLGQPVGELARAMGSESLEWGTALRQNSPWLASTTFIDAQEEATVKGQVAADLAWFEAVRRSRSDPSGCAIG